MAVLKKIRDNMNLFTTAERSFADYVIKNKDIIYKSITLVVEHSKIGYGTIIRFCQKLGYSGFQDFKIHLAVETEKRSPDTHGTNNKWLNSLAVSVGGQLTTAAEETEESELVKIAKVMSTARNILIIGVAGSFPACLELNYRLSRLGLMTIAEADNHMQAIRSSTLGKEDVLFSVSFSGSTKDILDAAKLAKMRGATVIALTNYIKTPLGELAEHILSANMFEGALEAEIGSRLPFFFLIEALCETIYNEVPDSNELIERTADGVSSKQI